MILFFWRLYSNESEWDSANQFSEAEYIWSKQQLANTWALENTSFNKQEKENELVNNRERIEE